MYCTLMPPCSFRSWLFWQFERKTRENPFHSRLPGTKKFRFESLRDVLNVRLKPEKAYLKIKTLQYNLIDEISRIFFHDCNLQTVCIAKVQQTDIFFCRWEKKKPSKSALCYTLMTLFTEKMDKFHDTIINFKVLFFLWAKKQNNGLNVSFR